MNEYKICIPDVAEIMKQIRGELRIVSKQIVNEIVLSISQSNPSLKELDEQYLTTNEVRRFLKISKTTLWRWKKEGLITPLKIGKKLMYRKSELLELINDACPRG